MTETGAGGRAASPRSRPPRQLGARPVGVGVVEVVAAANPRLLRRPRPAAGVFALRGATGQSSVAAAARRSDNDASSFERAYIGPMPAARA